MKASSELLQEKEEIFTPTEWEGSFSPCSICKDRMRNLGSYLDQQEEALFPTPSSSNGIEDWESGLPLRSQSNKALYPTPFPCQRGEETS